MAGFDSDIGCPGISVAVLDKPTRPKFVVSAPVPPLPDLRATVHYPTEAEIRSGQTDEVTYQIGRASCRERV